MNPRHPVLETDVLPTELYSYTGQGGAPSWVLAEPVSEFVESGSPLGGNYQSSAVPPRGWLAEVTVEIFDRKSRAVTASRAMGP